MGSWGSAFVQRYVRKMLTYCRMLRWLAPSPCCGVSVVWCFMTGDVPSGGGHVCPDGSGPRDGFVTWVGQLGFPKLEAGGIFLSHEKWSMTAHSRVRPSGHRTLRAQAWLCHLLAVGPGMSYLTSSFPVLVFSSVRALIPRS